MPNKKKLYNALVQEGYDNFENEESFKSFVENAENRKKLFNALKEEGYDNFSDEDSFDEYLGYAKPYTHEYDSQGNLVGGTAYQEQEPYQYKPEVQQHILENKPEIFKPKTVDMYGSHDKDKSELDLVKEGKLYQMKAMRAASTIGEQLDERIKANEEALSKAYAKKEGRKKGFVETLLSPLEAQKSYKMEVPEEVNLSAFVKDEDIANLVAEKEYLSEAKKVFNAAKNDAGFFQGMKDAVDTSFLTFGVSDINNAKQVSAIQQKLEAGQSLSDSEQSLLTSLGLQQIVDQQYNELLGRWYKAGKTTAEMAPFMAEMAVNPLSSLGKAAMKASIKKFGEKGAKAVASKMLSRTIGDVVGAAGMAATSGMPGVAADALKRQQGFVTTGLGEGGTIEGEGFSGGEDVSSAWRKAYTARTIENWSEMVGEYFSPIGNVIGKGITKGLDRMGLGKVNEFLDAINSSNVAKILDDFTEQTQWNGPLGEFAEEQVGMIADALLVGDTKWSDITDIDKQLDVALGVGVFGTFMSLLRIAGYRTPRYRARMAVDKADKDASSFFGEEWTNVKDLIDSSSDEELTTNLSSLNVSPEQMKAAFMYANALKAQQAVNTYKEKEKIDNPGSVEVETEAAYDEGSDLKTPYDKHSAKRAADMAESALGLNSENADEQQFAQMVVAGASNPVETVNAMAEQGYSEEQIGKAKNYYTAINRMNGMTDALLDNVNSQIESANAEVDANTNKNTGAVTKVVLRGGELGYVIEGTVIGGEEGKVDVNNSDDAIFVRLQNGEVKMMNPNKDLAGIAWTESPDKLKNENNIVLRERLIDKGIQEIDWNPATPNPKIGDSFEMKGVPVTIVSNDSNGGLLVVPSDEWQSAQGNEKKQLELIKSAMSVQASVFKQWASDQLDAQEEVVQENLTTENIGNFTENTQESVKQIEDSSVNPPTIPTKKDGSIDFVAYGKDNSFKELGNLYGEKMPRKVEVTANAWSSDLKKAKQKVDKAQEDVDNAPIGRDSKQQEALDKAKADYEAVKREADFWSEMDAEIKAAQTKPGEEVSEEILSIEEPLNGVEFAAQSLAYGNIKLLRDSFASETGFGNEESKKYLGLFASAEKGGVSVQKAGERLMEMDRENNTGFFDQNDPNAGRNAIIEALGLAKTKSELANMIKTNREEQARKEQEAEYAAYESWVEDNFHMSVEEFESYEQGYWLEVYKRGLSDEELQEFISSIEDETLNNEQYEQRIYSENEEGGGLLQKEQPLPSEGARIVKEGSGKANGGIIGENGTAPEGESGNEVISQIEQAREEVEQNPSEAQKEVGNYKKGHVKIDGFDITIENPKGGVRSGTDKNGSKWSITMNNDYGYFRGTEAVDGDHIDVFLSDNPTDGSVFVVDQRNEDGSFDESKVMYGFNSLDEAREAYLANYEAGWENRIMAITEVSKDEFKKWIDASTRKTKPFSEYKSVKVETSDKPYTVEPATYTTKKGKVLNMFLVKPVNSEMSRERQSEARFWVKDLKGWYDRKEGGWMLRSESDVKTFTEKVFGDIHSDSYDLITMNDVKSVSDGDISFSEPKQEDEYSPIWQYIIHVDKETGFTTLSREDISGSIPIGDAGFTIQATSPQEMLDILRNPLNGLDQALDAVGVSLENKIKTRELDRKLKEERKQKYDELRKNGLNGFKIGDKVLYKAQGKNRKPIEATIYDFEEFGEHNPVLDTGLSPVMYEVVRWEDISSVNEIKKVNEEKPKKEYHGGDKVFSIKHNTNKDILMAHHVGDKVEYIFTDGAKAGENEVQDPIVMDKKPVTRPKEGEFYKNNIAGGNAVAKISGVGKTVYVVSFASDLEDARGGLFMGEKIVEMGEMDKWLREGLLVKIENPSGNKLVSDERYAELRERMKLKLRGQMNIGIDPEILAIGTEMAVYHIEKGARKFAEYAKAMIEDLGDAIRPYLKAFYNGARDLPEMESNGLTSEMTPYEEVVNINTATIGKAFADVMEVAETLVKEEEVETQAEVAKKRVKRQSKPSKKTKENVSLLGDLFNQNQEENETGTEEQRRNRSSKGNSDSDEHLGGKAREEGSGTSVRGEAGSVSGHNVSDEIGSGRVHGVSGKHSVKNNVRNYSFGEGHIEVPSGDVAKLKSNIEAIRILKEIEASGQPASNAQKAILAKYVGWGGLSAALDEQKFLNSKGWMADRNWNEKYLPYYIELRELLTKEEFNDAVQSTNTSHYTPEEVIRGMWNVVERMGFKGGRVNEPAAGVGHILGLMPQSISERSTISGTELDSLSGRIAKVLYPDANIKVQGYETEFAPKTKDLVITNVPFGKTAPYDKALDKALRKKMGSAYNLHNYFIAKGLLELKEGGIGVFVTSSATMDGANSKFREWVAANGIDLVGAIRLPNDAFLKNAGTSVTADMLVFRKRKAGEPSNGVNFVSTTQIGEGTYKENGETRTKPIMVNEYFAEHPEMMLGEMMTAHDAGSGGLYSGSSQTCVASKGANLADDLNNAIMRLGAIDGNLSESLSSIAIEKQTGITDLKNGTLVVKGEDVLVAINGELQPIESVEKKKEFTFNGKKQKVASAVKDYNSLKETLKSLIASEQTSTEDPEPLRKKLNQQYDAFVKKYGTLNRNKALEDVLAEDFEHNLPLSLENVRRVPSATGKSMVWEVTKGEGILYKRVSYPVEEPKKAESLDDAINISRSYRGVIDIPYVASLIGNTEEEVTNDMLQEGLAYRNPITGNIEDKESYLSGNVKEKLEQARAMAEEYPEYQKNVEDLAEVQPETVRFGDISYRIGTPWIPTEYVNDFASEVLGVRGVDVQYMPALNEFVVSRFARVDDFAKAGQFRTDRVGVVDILEYALNQRKPKIFDKRVSYGPSGKIEERIPNEAETQAAAEKIMEVSDKFIEYIDGRSNIHRELERIYNDKYNNYRLKTYELPSFSKIEKDKEGNNVLTTHYPNSNRSISLREHQAKAVQRCLSESTLLAHQVGTGKTFTMITSAMEMRRLGIAKKPMIVVQNATLEDFVKDFYKLYPGANVLAPGKDERSAENRKRLFNLIATGDFDAIVIPQSFMQFIPDDEGRKKELIQKRIDEYERAIEGIEDYSLQRRMQKEIDSLRDTLEGKEKKRTVKDKAKAADRIKAKMERQLDRRTDDVMTFEQMGIDALFIDEAHNFKKIGFASKMSNVKGIDTSASQRANSLLLKAQYVQEKNGGRNVILATGTPITNTMAEVWTMMKFVSPEILDTYNIQSFDDFATTFGTVEPSLEFTATGNFKIADRFKSYVNVPELVKAFRSHADVVLTTDVKEFKQSNNIPKLKNDQMTNIVIEKNEDLEDVMNVLIRKLEEYNEISGSEKREMSALPLVVFSRAKQAAIDLRLLNPSYEDNPNSKTNHVVRNVLKLYKESTPEKGAQMIFCDSYQSPGEAPKMDLFDYDPDVPRFNLYEDIKKKLVEGGIPANEIAIVNNYDGERRKQLFEKVRNGDVRILLGSTEKMGVGVNVQDRMFALHHIDAPIRPMDFEQRNGRILRQGNLYATWGKPVNVVTYGVQGTLDATAYDRLRVKQDFINQMMKGDVSGRIMEEQDEEDPSGMTFNQMAATLSGDKTAQLLFVAENDLKKLRNLKRSDFNSKSSMGMTIQSEERRLVALNDKLVLWNRAKEITNKYFPEGVTEVKVNGQTITEKFGPALDPVVENYEEAYSLNRGTSPLKLSLNNGNAEVVVHFNEGKMVYELYAGKEHVVESRQFNGGKGLMSSIEHQLKATEKNYNETKQKISETKNKIQGLEKAMNAPWGREEELKKKEQEVAELKKRLEEQAAENTKGKNVKKEDLLNRLDDSELTEAEKRSASFEYKRMIDRVTSLSKKLGLNNVEIVTDASTLEGAQRKAKGFYSKSKRKITIVIPNHSSVFDAERTLLHEAVAHFGLRELFGAQFDVFLDNVYNNAAPEVRERINRIAMKNGWDFKKATEEYLASLAEDTNFESTEESWWDKIKLYFLNMLHQIGFVGFNSVTLTDNELRYILWRSYENLVEPGKYRSVFGEAADIAMQDKLNVGNYMNTSTSVSDVTEYVYTPENVIAEFEEVVFNHPDMYAIRTEEDIDVLPISDRLKRKVKEKINNNQIAAVHLIGHDILTLFVNKIGEAELRNTIPHELAHYASRNVELDDFYKMSVLDYLRRKYPEEYRSIVRDYAKEDWGEEAVAYLFEKKSEEIGFERLLNSKFDTHNDIGYVFSNIVNFLNNGRTGNNPIRRRERSDSRVHSGGNRSVEEPERNVYHGGDTDGQRNYNSGKEVVNEVEDDVLYRSVDEIKGMANNTARNLYENSIKGNGYRFQEGFQDSMLSLKKLQEAIVKQHGGKLEEWEDAYTAENQMSSRDTAEIENFTFNHFNPMMKAVTKFLKRSKLEYEDLRTYLFAKSGLERNRDFAVRDAISQRVKDGEDVSGVYEAYMQRKQELLKDLKDGTISFRKYCEEMDNEAMIIAPDLTGKDYSGLSTLFGNDNFTEDAIAEVESVESLANADSLWSEIKGATQFSLDRAKQSGVMNTDTHKKLSEMFEWYVPMRGWSETKARDVYEYFGSQEGVFNPTIRSAYGRKSLADDPLATIANMAESSIFQGNKNQMKQKLLNLAFDKPTNLITVMDSWIENKGTDTDPRWEYVYPPIDQDDDADIIAAKIKQFEEEMEQKKDQGLAKKVRGKADVPYIATPKEVSQHIIRVKRNGREFVMILNGNPRAAQAINGMTNPETYNGIIEQVSRRLNRFMAAAFTTKNPTFIMRNLSRDLIFSNTAIAVKESTAYGKKFRSNQIKVLGNMRGLMKRYHSGTLDMSNELDKMFMEFIKNGGETGFAQLTSVDEYKKKIQRELNIGKNGGTINRGKKVGRVVMDTIEFYNRCAEDVSRFTVFMTSRQMGRSIQRSVNDAKEITVNFNKRGSGSKAGGFIGFGAQSMRSLYLFFNAAVQALVNFKRLGQKHPVAFTTALSMYAVSGFLMPVVNEFLSSILGGDDDDYENLPEWVRRNNLVLCLGKWRGDAMFLTIPLPIEMRAFYGLGETANQLMAGNVRGKDAAWQIAGQFAEMLPLNFVTDGGGPFNAFTPDAFKPIVQAYITNKDWTGKPIYRDNGFNKELPEWTKSYAGTSKWLVNSAELLNEFTGGDKYKSGLIDVNPARLEHLFTGYLGGFGDMFLGGYKTLSMLWDEDYRNVRHTPVLKAFLNQSEERTSFYQVKKDYASFKKEYEETVRRLNGYEKELNREETAMEYAERMDFLQRSSQMKRYEIMKDYERELNKMYKLMKENPDSEIQKSITVGINQLKANAVQALRTVE